MIHGHQLTFWPDIDRQGERSSLSDKKSAIRPSNTKHDSLNITLSTHERAYIHKFFSEPIDRPTDRNTPTQNTHTQMYITHTHINGKAEIQKPHTLLVAY